jgi:hypothetical protein
MSLTTPSPSATTPLSASITGNAALDGLILKGITVLATLATTWLMSHLDLKDPNFAYWLTGAITSALAIGATAVWGVLNSRLNQVKAVTAGMNLVVSGAAITQSNVTGTVLKPVTPASAAEIVKNFGNVRVPVKDEPALTDKLNATQLPQ